LNSLNSIGGILQFYANNALTSIAGLGNLSSIGGNLYFSGNTALVDLTGLEGLTSVPGDLLLQNNTSLVSLTGLDNVTSIGEGLWIGLNVELASLAGLGNLTTIGEYITIWGNSILINLSGLDNVTSLTGYIELFSNNNLISLAGLDNISAGSISDLLIYDNLSLATCDVESICDYLASPNGTIEIHDNAIGCNSQTEVEEACEAIGINENNHKFEISIRPNPATNDIFIESKIGLRIEKVIIYNQLGQIALNEKQIINTIDVSNLQQGLYVIEIISNGLKIREKLIMR